MGILLDTHVIVDLLRGLSSRHPGLPGVPGTRLFASVASLWEIAIKAWLGQLDAGVGLDALPLALEHSGVHVLPVVSDHVLATLAQEPPTKDPFDRLLLAICQVECLRLATIDRALVGRQLALDTSPRFP